MSKRKSDAIAPLPCDYHTDEDAILQDEMDALLNDNFPPVPAWAHTDLVWFHFQSACDEDHRCLRICETPFVFPKASFRKCSLALVRSWARTCPSVNKLEFGLWDGMDPQYHNIFPTLVEVLAVFADGLWPASLEVLYLRYWRLGCCTSFVEQLLTFPLSLKELNYQSGNDDQAVPCMDHLNKFVKRTPKLETLSVCTNFARGGDVICMLPNLFNGIEQVCTSLANISIHIIKMGANDSHVKSSSRIGQGFNTAIVCRVLSNLPMLKKLNFSNCDLKTVVVDKILQTVLFHTQIEELALRGQPNGPGDDGVRTLRTYFRRPSSEISLKFLALEFENRATKGGLERELEMNLGSSIVNDYDIPTHLGLLNRYLNANHQYQSDLRRRNGNRVG